MILKKDYINGYEVKCFYTYRYDLNSNRIIKDTGDYVDFKNNMPIPYKTYCYNYGESFTVLDNKNKLAHIIDKGILIETLKVFKINSLIVNTIINTNGDKLKINTQLDLDKYMNNDVVHYDRLSEDTNSFIMKFDALLSAHIEGCYRDVIMCESLLYEHIKEDKKSIDIYLEFMDFSREDEKDIRSILNEISKKY